MSFLRLFKPRPVFHVDPHPDPAAVAQITDYCFQLHRSLLPQLGLFETFDVHFVTPGSLGDDILGRYIGGTWRRPNTLLDIETCKGIVTRQRRFTLKYIYHTTVLHELAHAVQDAYGLLLDEQEAEDFAFEFYAHGTVQRFWERR